jgi:hypothetical protein
MVITSFNSRVIYRVLRCYCAVEVRCRVNGNVSVCVARNRRDSVCNALLLQSYSLLWKCVPTIRRPAAARSVLQRERAQRSPAQQMGRLQLSGVMSQYIYSLAYGKGELKTENCTDNQLDTYKFTLNNGSKAVSNTEAPSPSSPTTTEQ